MNAERGFTLLELLIASTVLAVALLGTGLLVTRTLQDSANLRDHALAAILLQDLRARAALVGEDRFETDLGGGGVAGDEYRSWQAQVSAQLPAAGTAVCRDDAGVPAETPPGPCSGAGPLMGRLSWRRDPASGTEWRQAVIQP
jgi:prepilin-type N-terminal cleavage/methylation domain-containing protein